MRQHHRSVALLAAACVLGAACGGTATDVEAGQDIGADTTALDAATATDVACVHFFFGRRDLGGELGRSSSPLTDYLPNTLGRRVDQPGTEPAELYPDAAIVVGEIVEVTPGRAIVELPERGPGERDEDRQLEVAFDDPEAWWRTLQLTIRIDEAFADAPAADFLTSGVTIGGGINVDQFTNGLLHIGPAVFAVERDGGLFFPDVEDLWLIGRNGIYIRPIADDGGFIWPMRPQAPQQHTLTELRSLAAEPTRFVDIVGAGEQWIRAEEDALRQAPPTVPSPELPRPSETAPPPTSPPANPCRPPTD